MSSRLSKIRSVHTYVMPRTVYFGWICSNLTNASAISMMIFINEIYECIWLKKHCVMHLLSVSVSWWIKDTIELIKLIAHKGLIGDIMEITKETNILDQGLEKGLSWLCFFLYHITQTKSGMQQTFRFFNVLTWYLPWVLAFYIPYTTIDSLKHNKMLEPLGQVWQSGSILAA